MTGLTASYWTLAGAPPASRPPHSAAASPRGYSDEDMSALLDSYEVRVVEIEFVAGWSSDDTARREAARRSESQLYEVAPAVGSPNLNVGCAGASGGPRPRPGARRAPPPSSKES